MAAGGPVLVIWAVRPAVSHEMPIHYETLTALVPAATGDGRILFAQLDLQSRVDPSKPNYDPVAERILLNLLESK
jgi:hypothetical protein